ncbi:27138_t:CDS:2, partial [Dentiscutata erythropus]
KIAWEERLDSAEKVRQTVIKNPVINSINSEETSHRENQSEEQRNEMDIPNDDLTANLHKYHPAEHKDSKIELQYLFTYDLSQPLFVHTLQQDVSMLFSD